MRCQPCQQYRCEDCRTLGFGCECCGREHLDDSMDGEVEW